MTFRWEPPTCLLCGHEAGSVDEVRMGMVRWAEAETERRFAALPRCSDRAACRARVEGAGGAWEVVDAESRDERGTADGFTDAHRRSFEAARSWRPQPVQPVEPSPAVAQDPLLEVFG